jgi:hypothetical protein
MQKVRVAQADGAVGQPFFVDQQWKRNAGLLPK